MRRYCESYEYDAAGNFLAMVHAATNGRGLFDNVRNADGVTLQRRTVHVNSARRLIAR
jgi:hypothetical protein